MFKAAQPLPSPQEDTYTNLEDQGQSGHLRNSREGA